jgi:hypothetical protein
MFAAGSCTGAGLNPVDIDTLSTWQQVGRNRYRLIVVLYIPFQYDLSWHRDQHGGGGCETLLV